MWINKKKFNEMEHKLDALVDPLTARGSAIDKTTRLIGNFTINSNYKNLGLYLSNGFVQNIIDQPAEDATREWITISALVDEVEDQEIKKMIDSRLKELNIQKTIKELIRFSRMYAKGSFLYYAVQSIQVQQGDILAKPIPEEIETIEFINIIDDPDKVAYHNLNKTDPLSKNYNQMRFMISGQEIHQSRLSWLVNSFVPSIDSGLSIVQIVQDAITAQDSGLWSVNSILMAMAVKIFKSDAVANLDIVKKGELLAKIKHLLDTQSVFSLMQDESFDMLTFKIEGMKELFDFVFDNLSGMSRIPKMILLGKAHGVVTAGEFDTINYYAQIAKFQENDLTEIIDKIIGLIVKEKSGEIWKALGGDLDRLDVTFKFNSLWKLDPLSQSDIELKNAQRDQIDITIGKAGPSELRDLDPRFEGMEPFVASRAIPPDLEEPEIITPGLPIDKETDSTE